MKNEGSVFNFDYVEQFDYLIVYVLFIKPTGLK